MLVFLTVFFMYCTKSAQVATTPVASENTNELLSYKTATAPTIDGIWDNAKKLAITPNVHDPGNGLFAGYQGTTYPAAE